MNDNHDTLSQSQRKIMHKIKRKANNADDDNLADTFGHNYGEGIKVGTPTIPMGGGIFSRGINSG